MDYMHARYYGSNLGRFLSADPGDDTSFLNPQSWNAYTYVGNNPMSFIDDTGEAKVSFFIKTLRGAWQAVSRSRALRAFEKSQNVKIMGRGQSRAARTLFKDARGSKTSSQQKAIRHDGHQGGMDHYQPARRKGADKSHVFYEGAAIVGLSGVPGADAGSLIGSFVEMQTDCQTSGDVVTDIIDFLNPLKDWEFVESIYTGLEEAAADKIAEELKALTDEEGDETGDTPKKEEPDAETVATKADEDEEG